MRHRLRIWWIHLRGAGRYSIIPRCPTNQCGQRIRWWEFIFRNQCALHYHGLMKEEE